MKKIKEGSDIEAKLAGEFFGEVYKWGTSETIYHVGERDWFKRNSEKGEEAEDIQANRAYKTWLEENNYEME